ncbi:peptidyl-glycine alpha-amidating monooxygenase B isoform X1 [Mastacembelus armatus]|uniref:Peptidylglycine alpha-amidating monooxygenase n=1 Tax=Mastacembelus armatus TaxID=205130 RepID=A0A3Q3NK87_9TELE|nr:peptidyl-glycine alpha-amidating monooxygenase isoform X1 [Mastacembelus armatus]XP_026154051.1 peptidyl-glycine alpha-amidating monooxygenase isoform X1 [Mastacembelus armatus]XP_026154052.1 peptidyl-glycine alpha-amidating monooxygenase isoform X1 [Mastacembelus armatus]XP_026154053.1 peptidyl-glycine alpha-amidating monooxygenase isoform X1 [Mastacembelus armatus]
MMRAPVFCVVLAFICHSHGLQIQNPLHWSKRFQENVLLDPSTCMSRTEQPQVSANSHNFSVHIRMPGVVPAGSDTYLCIAFPVPTSRDAYIVDFIPHATMDTVHHMLLFGCQTPISTNSYWDCGGAQGTCEDEPSIMYAWARNAQPTKLPKDVGFKVGKNSEMPYFVLQIHYGDFSAFRDHHRDCSGLTLTMTSKPQPFTAGIYLLMSVGTVILPGKRVTNADIACDYRSYPIHPFAFRTHTHQLGKVVSGYRIRDGKWSLIGRQSPQLPQAFYPANKDVDMKYGDTIAARCMFTGEGRTTKTRIGATSADEMCNFYIMYYMDSKHAIPYMNCMETGSKELFQHIPAEASVPIIVSPEHLNSLMHMGHSTDRQDKSLLLDTNKAELVLDQGDLYSLMSKLLGQNKDIVHIHTYNPHEMQRAQADLVAQIDSLMQKKDLVSPSATLDFKTREDRVLVRDRVHKFHQLEATAKPPRSKLRAEGQDLHLEQVSAWPQSPLQLGQVSGLARDSDSNLVIFHRGDHYWGDDSFNSQARYQQRSLGPIQQSTILVVDPSKGNILKASGRNMFYMPHGITTDEENNYWVTDVALHQVLKVSSDGRDRTLVALGEAFTPGSDNNHFCKPTDVAVDTKTGNIFVSDGYCNARILKFSAEGRYLSEWGAGSSDRRRRIPFRIPHSLVFLPDRQEVCVADRENGRIQCFIAETGEFVKEIKKEEFGGKVFAITYKLAGDGGLIFAVNGESPYRSAPVSGFVINYSTKNVLDTFSPTTKEFKMPHDIVETGDGSVFVGDAVSKSVFKFTTEKLHRSVKKAGIEVQELQEVETFVQTKVRPEHNTSKTTTIQQKHTVEQQPQPQEEEEKENKKNASKPNREGGVLPVVITTLLLIPLLVIISIGALVCWRRNKRFEVKTEPNSVGGILGKIRGKAVGSLNLGNFFASHKGYSRQGFDQLNTEGSDQERNDEDSSDSENEEYSALPPPQSSS